ncbi:hypothetical protein [Amycolatopsis sp. NPDC051372]|uniref:hypothetical protein n=1 Tax=Amycolatopsis sp. NPDC051372 TaxID=3155669 RepID=UPI00341ED784
MSKEQPEREGFWSLGHKWITAIAALITALATAGIIVGVNSGSSDKSGNALPAPTQPASQAPAAPGSTAASSAPPASSNAPADPAVYYAGPVTWGQVNLDLTPPAYSSTNDIMGSGPDLYNSGHVKIDIWADRGEPGRNDCETLALTTGGAEVDSLHAGSIVCGITEKGRPFRLNVKVASSNGIVTDAVVWNA